MCKDNPSKISNVEVGGENMGTTVQHMYRSLDFSKLNFAPKPISSQDALRTVKPIDWTEEVISGKRKLIIDKTTE